MSDQTCSFAVEHYLANPLYWLTDEQEQQLAELEALGARADV